MQYLSHRKRRPLRTSLSLREHPHPRVFEAARDGAGFRCPDQFEVVVAAYAAGFVGLQLVGVHRCTPARRAGSRCRPEGHLGVARLGRTEQRRPAHTVRSTHTGVPVELGARAFLSLASAYRGAAGLCGLLAGPTFHHGRPFPAPAGDD